VPTSPQRASEHISVHDMAHAKARTSTSAQEWASRSELASASTSAQESACMRKQLALCCRSRAHIIRLVAAQIGLSPGAEPSDQCRRGPSAVPAQM